jgi:hypothetical protein
VLLFGQVFGAIVGIVNGILLARLSARLEGRPHLDPVSTTMVLVSSACRTHSSFRAQAARDADQGRRPDGRPVPPLLP